MLNFRKKIFFVDVGFFALLMILQPPELLTLSLVIACYMIINQAMLHRYTSPIQRIIKAVRHYQNEKGDFPSPIGVTKSDEFNQLSYSLNSLTERIENQIHNLIAQKEETETILESLGEGIIATDTSAKVTFINGAACKMLAISKSDAISQALGIQSDLSKKCFELILTALQTSEPVSQTWTVKDGGVTHLNLHASLLAHQKGALLSIQDKTSDYQVVKVGKDFVANASHEFRTPITIIRGFAETLQDIPDVSKEMLDGISEKIVKTCGRLDKLVRSLLTLTDIEHLAEERLKQTDLVRLAENCEHFLFTAHSSAKVVINSDLEKIPVIADSDLMELAILNLLENAVKYSHDSAEIEMHIKQEGGHVHLSVKDFGIGIAPEDLPHVFDRFYTVDKARSRKSGGAGLGLSIVKTIIEKHHGQILVRSELGKESTFTIVLPIAAV